MSLGDKYRWCFGIPQRLPRSMFKRLYVDKSGFVEGALLVRSNSRSFGFFLALFCVHRHVNGLVVPYALRLFFSDSPQADGCMCDFQKLHLGEIYAVFYVYYEQVLRNYVVQ